MQQLSQPTANSTESIKTLCDQFLDHMEVTLHAQSDALKDVPQVGKFLGSLVLLQVHYHQQNKLSSFFE